jgi:hypothetical protein
VLSCQPMPSAQRPVAVADFPMILQQMGELRPSLDSGAGMQDTSIFSHDCRPGGHSKER